jgi:hypothetical protein
MGRLLIPTGGGGRVDGGAGGRIVGSGLWRKKVGSEGLGRAEATWGWGTSCICGERRTQTRRGDSLGSDYWGSWAGLGPVGKIYYSILFWRNLGRAVYAMLFIKLYQIF